MKGDTKDNTEGNVVRYKNTKKELQTITKYNILSRYVAKKETITKLRINLIN